MKIGVVGVGTMGTGIVQCFSQHNYSVLMCSHSIESAKHGYSKLENQITRRIQRGKISQEEAEQILSRITVAPIEECRECDLVIECSPENIDSKKDLLAKLSSICKDDCILASNTSSLSITELSVGVKQSVIGMHFFNPAPTMKLVEVVPGLNTPVEITEKIKEIVVSLNKTPITVKENAGYVVNRLLIPMINEAIELYDTGVSSAEEIDLAMKLGANHPMGPLELGDFIGLDVCLAIMEELYKETSDSKYRPSPLLKRMVRGGWLGRKTGRGFYKY